jgi:hypothetical protein
VHVAVGPVGVEGVPAHPVRIDRPERDVG